jgi:hypothetical protein
MTTTGRLTTSWPTATARRGVRAGPGVMAVLKISSRVTTDVIGADKGEAKQNVANVFSVRTQET